MDENMPILSMTILSLKREGFTNIPSSVPMSWLNEETAMLIHDQSLSKLASRGGMGFAEIVCNMLKSNYRKLRELDEIKCMIFIKKKLSQP